MLVVALVICLFWPFVLFPLFLGFFSSFRCFLLPQRRGRRVLRYRCRTGASRTGSQEEAPKTRLPTAACVSRRPPRRKPQVRTEQHASRFSSFPKGRREARTPALPARTPLARTSQWHQPAGECRDRRERPRVDAGSQRGGRARRPPGSPAQPARAALPRGKSAPSPRHAHRRRPPPARRPGPRLASPRGHACPGTAASGAAPGRGAARGRAAPGARCRGEARVPLSPQQGVGSSTRAPRGPRGAPGQVRAGRKRRRRVLSEVNAGVCRACASARFPVRRRLVVRREGPLPPAPRGLGSQHGGKASLPYLKTRIVFLRSRLAGARGLKSSAGWDTSRCSFPPPRRDSETRTTSVHGGPGPGSCPRTRTPATPPASVSKLSKSGGLNCRPYPEISDCRT